MTTYELIGLAIGFGLLIGAGVLLQCVLNALDNSDCGCARVVPQTDELEKLRAEVESLSAENDKLYKQLVDLKNDAWYGSNPFGD